MTSFGVALIAAAVLLAIGILVVLEVRRRRKRSASLVDISTKSTLEALIPAIKEIEGGNHEHVSYFILEANQGLERLGSPYRFESTFSSRRSWNVTGEYVDSVTVVTKAETDARSREGGQRA